MESGNDSRLQRWLEATLDDSRAKTRAVGKTREVIVRAGRRTRREVRDHESRIKHLIDLQIRNEALQKQFEEKFSKLEEAQASTGQKLDALIDLIREGTRENP